MNTDAIKATLEDYAKAYCEKDIGALMKVFNDTDNISVIGTGADELCVGRAAIKELFQRNFFEATANRFEWIWTDTRVSGHHAVVSVTLRIHLTYMGEALVVPIRWTVVLKKEGGRWGWIHRHASSAAANQDDGAAYPKNVEQ